MAKIRPVVAYLHSEGILNIPYKEEIYRLMTTMEKQEKNRGLYKFQSIVYLQWQIRSMRSVLKCIAVNSIQGGQGDKTITIKVTKK